MMLSNFPGLGSLVLGFQVMSLSLVGPHLLWGQNSITAPPPPTVVRPPIPVRPAQPVRDIASRLELMVDRHLIDQMENTTLKLHEPRPAPPTAPVTVPTPGATKVPAPAPIKPPPAAPSISTVGATNSRTRSYVVGGLR